jgi:hypothetical protein
MVLHLSVLAVEPLMVPESTLMRCLFSYVNIRYRDLNSLDWDSISHRSLYSKLLRIIPLCSDIGKSMGPSIVSIVSIDIGS